MNLPNEGEKKPTHSQDAAHQPAQWEKVSVYVVAVFVIGLIAFIVLRNTPFADPNIIVFVRILLALAVAVLGAAIPGFLHIGWKGKGWLIRAGGACALFVLVYFFTPEVLAVPAPPPSQVDQNQVPRDDNSQSQLQFQQIEIDKLLCQWSDIERPFRVVAPDANPINGQHFSFLKPTIGEPLTLWPMGCHQTPSFQLEKGDEPRTIDPVFSIVLSNVSSKPMTLTAIGILPIAAWDAVKGTPCVIRLRDFDAITINMDGFDPSIPQLHRFDDPIAIGRGGSFRIKLRLAGYNQAVERNESGIKFFADVNQERAYSQPLYLGLCELQASDE